MELRQLQYFVAVARHRNFTRAAESLWITQSALSQQVRRLEAEVGVALLRRTSRGVELTPAGEDLLARASSVLDEVARAREELDRHAGAQRGQVRVAATTIDVPRLPAALAAFHDAHPGIQIALRHAAPAEVPRLVAGGAVDVAVAAVGGALPSGVHAEPLAGEPMRVMVAPGDPLASAGAAVGVGDLRGRPFILAEAGTPLRTTVVDACQAAGFSPVPLFEVSEPFTVRSLAGAGLGVSVVPASWFDHPGPEVAAVELAPPGLEHVVAILTPAAGATPVAALLAAALSEHLG